MGGKGTEDAAPAPVEDVGIDHRGADIVAVIDQMRGEGMAQGLTTSVFGNPRVSNGGFVG